MTTPAEARRDRLGDAACRQAFEVAAQAPDLEPDEVNALAVLMRDTRTTKAPDRAA